MGIGFKLLDTMIYKNPGTGAKGSNNCYWQSFEYMFVLTKGSIQTVNRLKDKRNIWAGTKSTSGMKQHQIGTRLHPSKGTVIQTYGIRDNVWIIPSGHGHGEETNHPAVFPEQLANDHILSWSNEGDLVLDPMCGVGTTCKMARMNNRNYIGIDISSKYCEYARKRLAKIPVRLHSSNFYPLRNTKRNISLHAIFGATEAKSYFTIPYYTLPYNIVLELVYGRLRAFLNGVFDGGRYG